MKTLKFQNSLFLLAIVGMLMLSCNEQDPLPEREVTKDYEFTGFDRLDLGDGFHVVVEQGPEYSVHVRGDERNVDDLIVNQDNGKLRFKYRFGSRLRYSRYRTYITITMPSLTAADFSGSVNANISAFAEDQFSLSLSGSSVVTLNLTANNVDFDLSGSSDLDVVGSAVDMNVSLSGSSKFEGLEFQVINADLDLSGSSDAKVNATTSLKATASGGSDVVYRGTPAINSSMSGESSIRQEGGN